MKDFEECSGVEMTCEDIKNFGGSLNLPANAFRPVIDSGCTSDPILLGSLCGSRVATDVMPSFFFMKVSLVGSFWVQYHIEETISCVCVCVL